MSNPKRIKQQPVRIMHFADVHFGVENYGRFDPETGLNSRLIDFRNALNASIDTALSMGIDLAVFAGDAYKTRDPSQTQQREFAQCLRKLTQEGVPVVLLTGNHDIPNMRGRANSIEIFSAIAGDLVTVLDKPGLHLLKARNGQDVQIAAVPYLIKSTVLSREEYKNKSVLETNDLIVERYIHEIDELASKCDPDLVTIFLGHFSVESAKMSAYSPINAATEPIVPLAALARSAFDYVALGHIHKHQVLNKGEQPPVVYSGSIERIDFGERIEEKGFVYAEISKGSASLEHIEVSTRPFVQIDVDLTTAGENPTEVLLQEIAAHDLKSAIVKLQFRILSEQTPYLRENEVRSALDQSYLVVAIQRDIIRTMERQRSKALTESLDPLLALAAYCDLQPTLKDRKEEMLEAARQLIAREQLDFQGHD